MKLGALEVQIRDSAWLRATVVFALLLLAAPAHAAFPGKNGKIAYAANSPNEFEAAAIASVNPDGTGKTLLTDYEFPGSAGISWSPDGAKVAFDDACCTIYTMNPDGSGRTEIDFSGWDDGNPAWSPDGTKVAFHTNRDSNGGTYDLYAMNADGTGQVRLTNDPASDLYPAWSPDGEKIAFFSGRGPTGIWAMDSDGGNPAFLANGISPNWSPDGSKIVFTDGAGSSSEIIVMDANGSNRTPLTNDSVVDRDPAWSPDGQKIVFAHGRVIYTMNANGTAMAQLVTQSFGEESQSAPDWQPLLGPQRGDYRNAAQFCKAERSFLGDAAFVKKYGTNENGANAYSKCVSGS